jgi:hypothetical protein
LIVSVSGRFLWGRGCPGGNPTIPEVSLQSVGWFGIRRWEVEGWPATKFSCGAV